MHDDAAKLADALRPARRILVFTGAGVSTGSGIPDYRGPAGVWTRRGPVYFDEFMRLHAKRQEYWRFKEESHDLFEAARPNAAHRALVRLEELGRVQALVTQNIDGLHGLAGTSPERLVEVHGTRRELECSSCWQRSENAPAIASFRATGEVPTCGCGGWLKSATISFGQPLDPRVLERALAEAARCDLVLALGSTLSVHPAASIPAAAARRGVPLVIVNRGDTALDELAAVRLEADVVEVLPPAVESLSTD